MITKKIISSLIIILLFCLCSCAGSRKVNKSESAKAEIKKTTEALTDNSKTTTTAESEQNIKRDVKIETSETETTETETIEPIDATKPATFIDEKGNKKELTNSKITKVKKTVLKNEKQSDNTNIIKNDKVSQIAQNDVKQTKVAQNKKNENKSNKESSRFSINLWWLLIIPVGYFVWRKLQKIKSP